MIKRSSRSRKDVGKGKDNITQKVKCDYYYVYTPIKGLVYTKLLNSAEVYDI